MSDCYFQLLFKKPTFQNYPEARFPLPELTGDRFPLPVNTGRVDGRAVSTSRVDGPCTGNGNRSSVNSGHQLG